jgi:ribosomal protein L11 methyltransferase
MAYHEFTISLSDELRDTLIQRLAQKGCLGFIENKDSFIAYFPEAVDAGTITGELAVLKAILEKKDQKDALTFSHVLIPEQDWNESWKKGFVPLDVGKRFTILPPWEKKHGNRINLIIDPGMAFGTGHHETTRSCLVLMEKYDGTVAKDSFLDLGTGTGLLAIAASKLGYKQVLAVDTDPLATEATRMNAGLNKVGNIEVREGSINEVSGRFDCIAANIISGVLILLAPDLASHLNPSGIAILSGILAEQADEVVREMEKAGLTLREKFPDGKWVSLVVSH